MVDILTGALGLGGPLAAGLLLRSVLAAVTAFALTALGTRWLLKALLRFGAAERVDKTDSEALAALHKGKAKTPTMGGLALVFGLAGATLLWAPLDNAYVQTALLLVAGFAAVGFLDDWTKLVHEKKKGLSIRGKFSWQILLAVSAAVALYFLGRGPGGAVEADVPLLRSVEIWLPMPLFLAFAVLVLVATVNAVNFTDGLDGLASGCAVITGIPLAVVAGVAGSAPQALGAGIPYVAGVDALAIFAAALAGAGLGFLWHNCFPARLFMGDTGSLALGASIGYVAVASKQELLLPIVGAVFVAEGLSVVLQVLSFRLTGRRIFLIAPLHHRYQFLGWPETQITIRFWISSALSAAAGAIALKI